MIANKQANFAQ